MLDHSISTLDIVSVHHVGNKNNDEPLIVSKFPLDFGKDDIEKLLQNFFLNQFKSEEYHHFGFSNGDFTLNPIYKYVHDVFEGIGDFHLNSINIAKHLYESSNHPNIKAGDLFIAYFSKLRIHHQEMSGIGIFKSENKQSFLKLMNSKDGFEIEKEIGMSADKPDKACLIFNTDQDSGYKILSLDKTNKSEEALFWKQTFLQLTPCKDEFHQTKEIMEMAKSFVYEELPENFEVNKTDQIDLMNKSMNYFKTHDTFIKDEFALHVFEDETVIETFQKYNQKYSENNAVIIEDVFDINLSAVKTQAKVYKSILKLDKNFHIYIHGNKELIVPGVESDGRKFYKIYYKEES
jgi:hypothetical protein